MSLPKFTADATLVKTRSQYVTLGRSASPLPEGAISLQQAPGCWLVGTQCRGFYQTCKYCCGDGGSYSEQCGSCFGWWDAPDCFPTAPPV